MNTREENPPPGTGRTQGTGTARRVFLTVVILGAALLLMVLPWIFLFHSPDRFAGWAATGMVLAIALHLFLNTRKRRRALQEMMEQGDDADEDSPGSS